MSELRGISNPHRRGPGHVAVALNHADVVAVFTGDRGRIDERLLEGRVLGRGRERLQVHLITDNRDTGDGRRARDVDS